MWSLLSWEAQHGYLHRREGGGPSTALKERRRLGASEGGEEEMRLRIKRRRLRQAGRSMGNEGGRRVKRDSAFELTWLSLKSCFLEFSSQLLSRVSLFFSFLKSAQCRTFYSDPPTDFLQHTEQAFGIASSHAVVWDNMSHQIPAMMVEFFIFFSCL